MKTKMGKYLCELSPNNPRATKEGYVYTHVLAAEKKLGRFLKPEECVHHADEDKYNNDPNNLMIFKTIADHTAFHQGVPVVQDGDVWWCPTKGSESKDLCPICQKNYKYDDAEMCLECRNKQRRAMFGRQDTPSRETFKYEIRTMTFAEIGQKYGVSDNAVRKLCKFYNLPYRTRDILLYSDAEWESETPSLETLDKINKLNIGFTDEEVIDEYCKNPKLGVLSGQLNMDRRTIKDILVKYNFRILNNSESRCIKIIDQYLDSGEKVGSFLLLKDAAKWLLENGYTGNNHTLSKITTRISKSLDIDSTAFGFIWKTNINLVDYRYYLINK